MTEMIKAIGEVKKKVNVPWKELFIFAAGIILGLLL